MDPAIRVLMLPRDTNERGTIFGGVILSHIDLAAAVAARRFAPGKKFVTVAMKEIEFIAPVHVGDIVSFYARLERVGRTSVTIQISVEVERADAVATSLKVTEAEVTFVAVDDAGRPIPVRD